MAGRRKLPQRRPAKLLTLLLKYQQWVILALALLLLGIPPVINYLRAEPLLRGGESYYHLTAQGREILSYPLTAVFNEQFLPLLPLALAAGCIMLFFRIARDWEKESKMFFLLLLLLTPAMLFAFSTLSSYSYLIFLLLLGWWILSWPRMPQLAALPLFAATFIDLLSAMLALGVVLFHAVRSARLSGIAGKSKDNKDKKEDKSKDRNQGGDMGNDAGKEESSKNEANKNKSTDTFNTPDAADAAAAWWKGWHWLLAVLLLLSLVLQGLAGQPFVLGPFHEEKPVLDIFTDLGSISGMSLFTILLAVIGLAISWKKWHPAHLILLLGVLAASISSHALFILAIGIAWFASRGFLSLLRRSWSMRTLKYFTLLLLSLGIIFSTLSYLQRLPEIGPSAPEREVLSWIRGDTASEEIVLAAPGDAYYVRYFAQRQPYFLPHRPEKGRKEVLNSVLAASYVGELFPLLEKEGISVIFLNPELQARLPGDYGLLFLLKNERFKMLYSREGYSAWKFGES